MGSASDLMSTAQVAERLRSSRMGVSRLVNAGRLAPAMTIGRARAFYRSDVERLAVELREEALAKAPEPTGQAS